jgi:hypothetical protein
MKQWKAGDRIKSTHTGTVISIITRGSGVESVGYRDDETGNLVWSNLSQVELLQSITEEPPEMTVVIDRNGEAHQRFPEYGWCPTTANPAPYHEGGRKGGRTWAELNRFKAPLTVVSEVSEGVTNESSEPAAGPSKYDRCQCGHRFIDHEDDCCTVSGGCCPCSGWRLAGPQPLVERVRRGIEAITGKRPSNWYATVALMTCADWLDEQNPHPGAVLSAEAIRNEVRRGYR